MAHRVVLFAASVAGCMLLAGQAFAQTAVYQGATDHITLQIPVHATVGVSCAFTATVPSASYTQASALQSGSLANLDAGFSQDTAFGLNCSGPSRVSVVSQNGGLLTAGTPAT